MPCFVPFSNRNLDISILVFIPMVVVVDDLINALKLFSSSTESMGCVHSSIFRSIHGNMVILMSCLSSFRSAFLLPLLWWGLPIYPLIYKLIHACALEYSMHVIHFLFCFLCMPTRLIITTLSLCFCFAFSCILIMIDSFYN